VHRALRLLGAFQVENVMAARRARAGTPQASASQWPVPRRCRSACSSGTRRGVRIYDNGGRPRSNRPGPQTLPARALAWRRKNKDGDYARATPHRAARGNPRLFGAAATPLAAAIGRVPHGLDTLAKRWRTRRRRRRRRGAVQPGVRVVRPYLNFRAGPEFHNLLAAMRDMHSR
jgi:hypothetical protein